MSVECRCCSMAGFCFRPVYSSTCTHCLHDIAGRWKALWYPALLSCRTMSTNNEFSTDAVEKDLLSNSDVREHEPSAPPLSKSARKRLEKDRLWRESAEERKKKRKARIQRVKERIRKEKEEGSYKPTYSRPLQKDIVQSGVTVVIDAGFEDLMTDNDNKSVMKQVSRCYSANRRSVKPVHLCISSWGGKTRDFMHQINPGHENWKAKFLTEAYHEAFEKEKLVYLSADSENCLTTLEEDSVYIIGGIVDHNHHKGLCHRLAVERGIRHARLPISQYVDMATRHVLTINHVFEILGQFVLHGDWAKAFFDVVPKRKGLVMCGTKSLDAEAGTVAGVDECGNACSEEAEDQGVSNNTDGE